MSNATPSDSVGKAYGYLLVGTYNSGNRKWWENSYAKYKLEKDVNLSNEFKGRNRAQAGFSGKGAADEGKYLNKLCETVYKKDLTAITPADDDANKGLLEKNL